MKLPFRFFPINPQTVGRLSDGRIISTFECCGLFLCSGGEIEILFGDRTYSLHRGDMYIYVPSTIVRLMHKSLDAEGLMIEIDLPFIFPLATASISVENLLMIRQHPCTTLDEEQFGHIRALGEALWRRIGLEQERMEQLSLQRRALVQDILKSMAQTMFYEVVNVYYANRPLQPLPQGKKDLVFHNFMVALFRHYGTERNVTFYAGQQHLAPRYFSAIIKQKSGITPLQWIVQMVITEARQLLERPELSVKEVAARLNFPTQSFFGKYFKQYVGISPKEYREGLNIGE